MEPHAQISGVGGIYAVLADDGLCEIEMSPRRSWFRITSIDRGGLEQHAARDDLKRQARAWTPRLTIHNLVGELKLAPIVNSND
jgi:hypothetical protein